MNDAASRIIDVIRRNRISSVEVADALGKRGVLHGFRAMSQGHFRVGAVQYVCTWGQSNWPLHAALESVPEDSFLYVDAIDCEDRAVLGDIMCKYLFLYRRIGGLAVNGLVRDSHRLLKENYAIWCLGQTPLGCYNRDVPLDARTAGLMAERREQLQGSVMVADDSGCTVIPASELDERTLRKLEWIEVQEDIWYFCIDTLKWSTFDTICMKRYLVEPDVLPASLKARLLEFSEE